MVHPFEKGSYVNVIKYIDFINSTIAPGECWYNKMHQGPILKNYFTVTYGATSGF